MSLKIKIHGFKSLFSSTERIQKSLIDNYDCVESDEPDLLINCNGPFAESEEFYNRCNKKPVRIYTLLDIDPNKPISWYSEIKCNLENCEIPCVISQTVKKDVEKKLGVKNLNILPYPIQNVNYLHWFKTIHFLWSGRCYSNNKRFSLAIEFLKLINFEISALVTVGPENPGVGIYVADLPETDLNELFNSSAFLLSPSQTEGLNLNVIQAIITRTIPIICNDCEVNFEHGLQEFVAEPTPLGLARKFTNFQENYNKYYDLLSELAPKMEEKYMVKAVCQKIIDLYKNYQKNLALPQEN